MNAAPLVDFRMALQPAQLESVKDLIPAGVCAVMPVGAPCHLNSVTDRGLPSKNLPILFMGPRSPLHGELMCLDTSLAANSNSGLGTRKQCALQLPGAWSVQRLEVGCHRRPVAPRPTNTSTSSDFLSGLCSSLLLVLWSTRKSSTSVPSFFLVILRTMRPTGGTCICLMPTNSFDRLPQL